MYGRRRTMSKFTSVDKTMKTVRSGAIAWLDEHVVDDAEAEQLFRYIEAALDYQQLEDADD
jgi:hypothetical protein